MSHTLSQIISEDKFWHKARSENCFHKGDLKYLLLFLITEKPRHGYELIREIEERSHGFYKPSPGVIYPTLQMLEEMGYACSTEENSKKVYAVTEEGRKLIEEQKDITEDLKSHIKHNWKMKNIGKKVMILGACHTLKSLLHDHLRKMDEAKTEKVISVITRAYRDIEKIIEE